jgi:hypothetical protein
MLILSFSKLENTVTRSDAVALSVLKSRIFDNLATSKFVFKALTKYSPKNNNTLFELCSLGKKNSIEEAWLE